MYFYTFSDMTMMFVVGGGDSDMVEYRGLSVKFHVHILDHRPLCYSDNTLIAWGAFNDIPQMLSAIRSVGRSLTASVRCSLTAFDQVSQAIPGAYIGDFTRNHRKPLSPCY